MKKLEKMKADNSQKENENYMQSLKSNDPLKKVLFKAKNISTTLMTNIVPQLATSIKNMVAEMLSNKNITKLKDWNTIKFLRQHCYDLADYDRKENINSAFEMAVTRGVKLGLMLNDTLAILENLHKLAKSNPQKLIEKITDEDVGTIASIKVILSDDTIRNNFIKTMDNQSLSGKELKKTA